MKFLRYGLLASAAIFTIAADDVSVNGKWQVSLSISGTDREQSCAFTQKDKELTGTCETDRGTVKLTGKVDEKNVTWKYLSEYNGGPLTVVFQGAVDAASKITGKVTVQEFGVAGEFTATQAK